MTDNTVNACPECDSTELRVRATRERTYKCKDCGTTFDDPVIRESRRGGVSAETMIQRALGGADE